MIVGAARVLLLASCAAPDAGHRRQGPRPTAGAPETSSTGETVAPADTDTGAPVEPSQGFDCSSPLPAGPFEVERYDIATTDDFDFDALGSLVSATAGQEIVSADVDGNVRVVSPFVYETRGIQAISDGNLVVAYVGQGRLGWIDRATGATALWLGDLVEPDAVEIGRGDVVYVGELGDGFAGTGRILRYDRAADTLDVLAEGFDQPQGLALNEEEDLLYVADHHEGIFVLAKDADGGWGPWGRLFDPGPGDHYDAVEVDVCGRVYVLDHDTGELYRYDPAADASELLVDLQDADASWPSMRWGSGRGGWARDVLYATAQDRVVGVHVGVPGRTQPIDALP